MTGTERSLHPVSPAVQPDSHYRITGQWSGEVTGNAAGNATWWEVVAFDGVVDDNIIDQGLRLQGQLIDKIEQSNLANNEVFQFQWQPFSGEIVAASNVVTLAFKQGSFSTFDAAADHDDVSMQLLAAAVVPGDLPVLNNGMMILVLALLLVAGATTLHGSGVSRTIR